LWSIPTSYAGVSPPQTTTFAQQRWIRHRQAGRGRPVPWSPVGAAGHGGWR
jgi:hypothetical protein